MIKPIKVAIIGGGRWAKVLASASMKILPKGSSLLLYSEGNQHAWNTFATNYRLRSDVVCHTASSQSEILTHAGVSHVLIARLAKDHAVTALAALKAGKRVFVEKPFANNLIDAEALVEQAISLQCLTGLVFRYSSNLRLFSNVCKTCGIAAEGKLIWSDPVLEKRHGGVKKTDVSLNVAWDVLPHIWSILKFFTLDGPTELITAWPIDGLNGIGAKINFAGTCITVEMRRNASKRQRILFLKNGSWDGRIDFSEEPGKASISGKTVDVAKGFSSPLERQLNAFFDPNKKRVDPLCDVIAAIEALRLADQISNYLKSI